jgi:hypothetical protein
VERAIAGDARPGETARGHDSGKPVVDATTRADTCAPCGAHCCSPTETCLSGNTCCAQSAACGDQCCTASQLCYGGASPPSCRTINHGETAVFVAVGKFDGLLGGRTGADQKCAAPAGVPCVTAPHALLSVEVGDAIKDLPTRFGLIASSPVFFFNRTPRRLTPLAADWSSALNAYSGTPLGTTPAVGLGISANDIYWTGSKADGSADINTQFNYTCKGWTYNGTTDPDHYAAEGSPGSTSNWLANGGMYSFCDHPHALLCVCSM